jgi:abhydrolase domain-containing protein 6
MKKLVAVGIGLIILLSVGIYFIFPKIAYRMAQMGERYMAKLVKKVVQVDDHTIAYLEGGEGETVLLLHGFGGSKELWMRFARHLTTDYHVVVPDIAGFGESSQIAQDRYDAEAQVKRIDRFMQELKIEKFHLAGNSLGGMYALMYGATYPKKVMTLGLLAPAGIASPKSSEAALLLHRGINPLLTGSPEDYERLINLGFAKPPFIPSQLKKVLIADAIAHREFNAKIWKDMGWDRRSDPASPPASFPDTYLSRIQAPALIIWGDTDRILDVGGAAVLETKLKNCRTVIMKETGHMPMLEKHKETASHYLGFLKGTR